MNLEKGALIAILSLTFMLFVQACTGIWWASRITTVQDSHSAWIMNHQTQQQDYPVLINRVEGNTESITKLGELMKDFLKELRQIKEQR